MTGKGNYTGKETQAFVIRPKNLSDKDVVADDLTLPYNGSVRKPVPAISWNGKKLSKSRDYTVSYPDEERDGAANPDAYTKAGDYTVLVRGMGNYTGEREVRLRITRNRPVSGLKVSKIADQIYTGEEVHPAFKVKAGKVVLAEGVDYEVSYQNNVKVGQASAVITGKGNYVGTKRVAFKIRQKTSLNQAKAELQFENPVMYTGGEVKPDGYKLTVSAKKADGSRVVETLVEGKDFTVSYQNHIRPGTAAVLFQGIKTYKINACDIGENAGTGGNIRVELADAYPYAKGGCKPEPVVSFQGEVLKKGKDYTLSYKNNTGLNDGSNAGKLSVVTIRVRGCFTGICELTYKITAGDLGGLMMEAADKVWRNKKNIYPTNVVIRDTDGKPLSAGKDYERRFRYEYGSDTKLSDGTARKAGEEVSGNDIIPAGTVIRVTAYAWGSHYTGTLTGSYRITKADI